MLMSILWRLFEYYSCLQQNVIPWHLVPPGLKEKLNIPIKDYGIDGISLDFKKAVQAKWRTKSAVTFRELSTFYTSASCLTKSEELVLVKSEGASIVSSAKKIPMKVETILNADF